MTVESTVAAPPRQHRLLSLRGRDRILSVVSPIGLLLVWEVAARVGLIDTRFFPAPSAILSLLIDMLKSGELLTHTAVSLRRLFWGSVIGGIPALVLGIVGGAVDHAGKLVQLRDRERRVDRDAAAIIVRQPHDVVDVGIFWQQLRLDALDRKLQRAGDALHAGADRHWRTCSILRDRLEPE